MDKQIITGIIVDDATSISYVEVCQQFDISEESLLELIEHGLLAESVKEPKRMSFNRQAINKIQSAYRLKEDLGINIPGVVLVLELLEEMETMRHELGILRHFLHPDEQSKE